MNVSIAYSCLSLGVTILLHQGLFAQFSEFEPTSPSAYDASEEKFDAGVASFTGGMALPLGQFAENDLRNYFAGFALPGFSLPVLNYQNHFTKNIGAGLHWSRHQLGFDTDKFVKYFDDNFTDARFRGEVPDPWVINNVLGNFVVVVPHDVLDLDVRMGIGFSRVTRPGIMLEGHDPRSGSLMYSWEQKEATAIDLLFGFGMSLRFHTGEKFDFVLACDYQRMSTTMEIEHYYALSITEYEMFKQTFELLTPGIGVAYRL